MICIWIMPTVSIKIMRRPHKNVEELIAFLVMIRIWNGEEPLGSWVDFQGPCWWGSFSRDWERCHPLLPVLRADRTAGDRDWMCKYSQGRQRLFFKLQREQKVFSALEILGRWLHNQELKLKKLWLEKTYVWIMQIAIGFHGTWVYLYSHQWVKHTWHFQSCHFSVTTRNPLFLTPNGPDAVRPYCPSWFPSEGGNVC